ncbi:hypothetical protein RJ641_014350 [Dillenia turbinata]|uniref:Uncharacterized protein n=1 Tax=Dillenia turbinata TaxID=194707 RepID=A0AAN8Z1A8_9MAGN
MGTKKSSTWNTLPVHSFAVALFHVSLVTSNWLKLVKLGSVGFLLGLVKSGHMVSQVLLIMGNLSSCDKGQTAMLDAGAVGCFVGLLKEEGSQLISIQESCVAALFGLSRGGLRFKWLAKEAGLKEPKIRNRISSPKDFEGIKLKNPETKGSRGTIPSRTQSWAKGMKLRKFATTVHMVGRIDWCMLSMHGLCLRECSYHNMIEKDYSENSEEENYKLLEVLPLVAICWHLGASRALGTKRKNLKILAFKGSPQNNEAGSRGSGSKIPNKPVELSYAPQRSEELREESPKLQHEPLSCASGGDEAIGRSQAIQNLFKKWLTMLRTPSPEQVADEVLGEGSIRRELPGAEDGDPAQEKVEILKTVCVPWYLAVNVIYGAEVSKELTPLWIFGPLIVALYIKMLRGICALYVFSFKQTVKIVKNLPTYYLAAYIYITQGKLKEDIRACFWQPVVDVKNTDYKQLSRQKLKDLEEWLMEKYLDFVESIWPHYCRTISIIDFWLKFFWVINCHINQITGTAWRCPFVWECNWKWEKFLDSSSGCPSIFLKTNWVFLKAPKTELNLKLSEALLIHQQYDMQQQRSMKAKVPELCQITCGTKLKERSRKRQCLFFAISGNDTSEEFNVDDPKLEKHHSSVELAEDIPITSSDIDGSFGKPGFVSFYSRTPKREDGSLPAGPEKTRNSLLWFVAPTVLVASFIFPSLYLRKILSTVFEDSLLTDFLILFFTEALFYCGVAAFLLILDNLKKPVKSVSGTYSEKNLAPRFGQRISSVAILVLSLIIPMVTMGLVWPWTGPAASATLAPYLVGIVVQFAFERCAIYVNSPSWPVIPVIFQPAKEDGRSASLDVLNCRTALLFHTSRPPSEAEVIEQKRYELELVVYRLHQLNRAAQLVTALSFTVRGAEMTSHNLAINSSLGTLLNVLQLLGVICIWSLSSFLMRFFPPPAAYEHELSS